MKKYYTEKQYKELLGHLVILCQTNEQVNDHILNYFDEHGIRYRQRAIGEGDYSFMIDAAPELGFPIDTFFTDELFIERKNSLQELAQSLYGQKEMPAFAKSVTSELKKDSEIKGLKLKKLVKEVKEQFSVYDDAFRRELKRAANKKHKYLLVEQPSGWDGILNHDYPNNYSEKAFWGMLHRLEVDYGLRVKFISRENMALEIYTICKFILDSEIER